MPTNNQEVLATNNLQIVSLSVLLKNDRMFYTVKKTLYRGIKFFGIIPFNHIHLNQVEKFVKWTT